LISTAKAFLSRPKAVTAPAPQPHLQPPLNNSRGVVLLQINRDNYYNPKQINFAALTLPSSTSKAIKK
jgi:hypothetical protein